MCFYNRLKTILHQEGQDYLDGSRKRETNGSFLEGFLTSVAGTLQHVGVKVFLLGLHYLEICLYIVKAPSAFWSPERDYFLQLKDFPTMRCGLCNPGSPRLEEGIHTGTRRLSGSLTLESAILLLQPRMFSFGSRMGSSAFWDPRLLSEKNYFFSPADELRSPSLPSICLFWAQSKFGPTL